MSLLHRRIPVAHRAERQHHENPHHINQRQAEAPSGRRSDWVVAHRSSRRISAQKLLGVGYQMNVWQFLYVLDHDGVRPPPFINLAANLHVFSDEWHQALALILVWHRRGYRRVNGAVIGQEDQRRSEPGAIEGALQIEFSRTRLFVLYGASNVTD